MARITPPTQSAIADLEDYEPYKVSLKKIDWQDSSPEYGGESRMVIDWALLDQPDVTVRDWVSLRLGRQQSGHVSKLRKILYALADKPEASDIAWFDDESYEWSYDGDKAYAALSEGLPLTLIGKTVEKQTENGPKRRFAVVDYKPAAAQKSKPSLRPRPRPEPDAAVKDVDPEDIPF